MAKQSLSVRTTNVTAANAAAELRASATESVLVTEIDIFMAGAGGGTFGIGFPALIGVTPTAPVTLLSESGQILNVVSGSVAVADRAPTASVALAWGTGPTVPAAFLRRVTVAASVGTFVSLTFPEGILVPANTSTSTGSLVVWNISTTDVADITFVVTKRPIGSAGRLVVG